MSDEKTSQSANSDADKPENKKSKNSEIPDEMRDEKNMDQKKSEEPEKRYVYELKDDDSWLFSCRWPTAQVVPEDPQVENCYAFVESLGEIKDKLVQLESYRKTLSLRVAAGEMTPEDMERKERDMLIYVRNLNKKKDALVVQYKAVKLPNLYQHFENAVESLVTMQKLAALYITKPEQPPEQTPTDRKAARRDAKGHRAPKPPRDPNKPKRQYRKRKTTDGLVSRSMEHTGKSKRQYRKRNATAPGILEGKSPPVPGVATLPKRQYRKRNTTASDMPRVMHPMTPHNLNKPKRQYRKRENAGRALNSSPSRPKRQYRKRKAAKPDSPRVLDLSMQREEEKENKSPE